MQTCLEKQLLLKDFKNISRYYNCQNHLCIHIYMANEDEAITTVQVVYMIVSAIVAFFLIILIILYFAKWRHQSIPIMQVLVILIFNEVFQSVFQMLSYIPNIDYQVCIASIIGRLAFTVASSFWIIFITRLIYREKLAPGKYFNLLNFMLKNIVMAYIPSIILGVFLFFMILLTGKEKQQLCSFVFHLNGILDYIIYATCFIFASLVTLVINTIYLKLYFRLKDAKWTIFLSFPFVSIIFGIYYLGIKIYQLCTKGERQTYLQIPLITEPLIFGILFVIIYLKQRGEDRQSSDITIQNSDMQTSFIDV